MANHPGGKGSTRRPSQVAQSTIDENFERIFGKKTNTREKDTTHACQNQCPGCTCRSKDHSTQTVVR